jgi:hypothetical protein
MSSPPVPGGSALIGVALSLLASAMNATGLNLQKLGQRAGAAAWLNGAGIALAALSGVVDMVSFGFAPQSLLAPLSAFTLICNLALAPVLQGERLSQTDLVATAMVCGGIAVTLSSAPGGSPAYSVRDLWALARRSNFVGFLAAYVSVGAALAGRARALERAAREPSKGHTPARASLADMAVLPMLSGMLGGLTVLSAKLVTELLKVTSLASHWYAILPVAILLAACAVSQTAVLNVGLGKHSSLFVVPVFSATMLLCNLSAGGIFFDEFSRFSRAQLTGFLLGVSIVVAGVGSLAAKGHAQAVKQD